MGIERRRNKLYYYRKRRDGDRVVSEYVGGGLVADLARRRDQIERARREAAREQLKAAHMSMADIDQAIDDFSSLVDTLMAAELNSMGYHQHRRQWRRKRDGGKL